MRDDRYVHLEFSLSVSTQLNGSSPHLWTARQTRSGVSGKSR